MVLATKVPFPGLWTYFVDLIGVEVFMFTFLNHQLILFLDRWFKKKLCPSESCSTWYVLALTSKTIILSSTWQNSSGWVTSLYTAGQCHPEASVLWRNLDWFTVTQWPTIKMLLITGDQSASNPAELDHIVMTPTLESVWQYHKISHKMSFFPLVWTQLLPVVLFILQLCSDFK